GDPKPANAELFALAQNALPSAQQPDELAAVLGPYLGTVGGAGDKYTLELAWTKPVTNVETYPQSEDALQFDVKDITTNAGQIAPPHAAAMNRALAAASVIQFNAHVLGGQKLDNDKLPLLIVYTSADGKRHGFFTPVDLKLIASMKE